MIAAFSAGPDSAAPQVRGLLDGEIEVALNPTGIAPLAAIATFQTRRACDVRMRVPGRDEVVHYFNDDSLSHSIPILGLYRGQGQYRVPDAHSAPRDSRDEDRDGH